MTSSPPDNFDHLLDEWRDWQSAPWGRLLYSLARHNLGRRLSGSALRILDVGGGNGVEALYYAGLGHRVLLLDASAGMLKEAQEAAARQGLLGRLDFCRADAMTAGALLRGGRFDLPGRVDLILCNLMIEFVPDPFALLRQLCGLLAQGGLLSLVDGNRYSEAYRIAFQRNDLAAAREAVGRTENFHPWVNRLVPQFSAEEVIAALESSGCELVGRYGLLCICGYLPNAPKFEAGYYAELEALEQRLADTYPYYLLARFFQVVVKKA